MLNLRKTWIRNLLLAMVFGFAASSMAQPSGGTLRYATVGDPPSLDAMLATVSPTGQIIQHIYETLFAFDASWAPRPFLVDTYEYSEEGRRVDFELRTGVYFHNGAEMTAEDVVASVRRWTEFGVRGRSIDYSDIGVTSRYGFYMTLDEPFAPLEANLAYAAGGPVIMPKEIIEAAGGTPITADQAIGTGPYKFQEWRPAQVIRLVRFEDYSPHPDEPSGYHGQRHAYLDEIHFMPVPDPITRVTGVLAGDYDYGEVAPSDLYDMLLNDSSVDVHIINPPRSLMLMFNTREGALSNQTLRQALLAALDMQPIIEAAYGPLGELNGTIASYLPGMFWYTEAGLESYNQGDAERAQALAAEAGYDGELIRFMTTTTFQEFYNASLVITDQLKRAGFNVEMEVFDWATVSERRQNPALWEIFMTQGGPKPDPSLTDQMNPLFPSWWETATRTELGQRFNRELDPNLRYELWSEYQLLWYEEVPSINLGMSNQFSISGTHVKGLSTDSQPHFYWPYMWNAWLEN